MENNMPDNMDFKSTDWGYFLDKAVEASDGKCIKIVGYDDYIIGTSSKDDDAISLVYSFAKMLAKFIRETEVVLDDEGFELSQAVADLWEMISYGVHNPDVFAPVVVDDM